MPADFEYLDLIPDHDPEYGIVLSHTLTGLSYADYKRPDEHNSAHRDISCCWFIRDLSIEELLAFNDIRIRKIGQQLHKRLQEATVEELLTSKDKRLRKAGLDAMA